MTPLRARDGAQHRPRHRGHRYWTAGRAGACTRSATATATKENSFERRSHVLRAATQCSRWGTRTVGHARHGILAFGIRDSSGLHTARTLYLRSTMGRDKCATFARVLLAPKGAGARLRQHGRPQGVDLKEIRKHTYGLGPEDRGFESFRPDHHSPKRLAFYLCP